jgi:hypothetical protein
MLSSGIWHRMALVRRTDVSQDYIAYIIRITNLGFFPARSKDMPHDGRRREPLAKAPPQSCLSVNVELLLMGHSRKPLCRPWWGVFLLRAGKSQRLVTLKIEAICSSETSVLTRFTRRHIPEHNVRKCLSVCNPLSAVALYDVYVKAELNSIKCNNAF